MISGSKHKGFTLIELLVVISLMMMVIALVAPMGVEMVDKARAQTQYINLQSFLKKQSQRAFLSASPVYLKVQDTGLIFWQSQRPEQIKAYEAITFLDKDVEFRFNRSGLASVTDLRVQVGNQVKVLDLANLWGKGDDQ